MGIVVDTAMGGVRAFDLLRVAKAPISFDGLAGVVACGAVGFSDHVTAMFLLSDRSYTRTNPRRTNGHVLILN